MLNNTLCWIVTREETNRVVDTNRLRAFTTNAAGQLNVLGHDGDTLGMDCAQVGVLEERDEVRLGCLLEGQDEKCASLLLH